MVPDAVDTLRRHHQAMDDTQQAEPADATTGPTTTGPTTPGPTTTGPTTTGPTPRRLSRSTSDRKIAGVAGGLGDYFGVDPTLFRLGLVVLTFMGGAGVLLYLLAWVVLPEGDGGSEPGRRLGGGLLAGISTVRLVVGGALVALGVASLVDVPRVGLIFPWSWPLVLIVAGLAVLLWTRRRDAGDAGDPSQPGPPHAPTPGTSSPGRPGHEAPMAPGAGVAPAEGETTEDRRPGAGLAPWAPATPPDRPGEVTTELDELGPSRTATPGSGDEDGADGVAGGPAAADGAPLARSQPPRSAASATVLTLGAIFLYWGLLALGDLAGGWETGLVAVLGGALLLTGAGLVASVWLGRGLLLIPLGILLAFALSIAAWLDVPLGGGFGERDHVFTDVAQIEPAYELAAGQILLDLTAAEIDQDVDLEADVGFGQVKVDVPADVDLLIDARAGLGEVIIIDTQGRQFRQEGVNPEVHRTLEPRTSDGDVVRLSADVGVGQVVIRQVDMTRSGAQPAVPTTVQTPASTGPPDASTTVPARVPTTLPAASRTTVATLPANTGPAGS
jgi:phage shock protein PspC (stress-responsive transcriptional regulator)